MKKDPGFQSTVKIGAKTYPVTAEYVEGRIQPVVAYEGAHWTFSTTERVKATPYQLALLGGVAAMAWIFVLAAIQHQGFTAYYAFIYTLLGVVVCCVLPVPVNVISLKRVR